MLTHVWLFSTPWTLARQAPLSMGSPGKNTGVGCHVLLQGIFLIQGSNPLLLKALAGGFFTTSAPWETWHPEMEAKQSGFQPWLCPDELCDLGKTLLSGSQFSHLWIGNNAKFKDRLQNSDKSDSENRGFIK